MTSTQMHFGTTFHCYPFSTCLHHHAPLPPSPDDDFAEANAPGFVDDGYDDVIYDDDDEVSPFDA